MSDGMLRRVGLEIAAAMVQKGKPGALDLDWPWLSDGDSNNDYNLEEMAAAAIKAMREPTDAMKLIGENASADSIWANRGGGNEAPALEAWKAMIDEALDDESKSP